jgi:hypothetical protein
VLGRPMVSGQPLAQALKDRTRAAADPAEHPPGEACHSILGCERPAEYERAATLRVVA